MRRGLLLLILFLTVIKSGVSACDCDETPSFETELKGSDKIFVGQVISIKPYKAQKEQKLFSEFVIEFKIEKVYKGTVGKNVQVRTAVAVASCGYPFQKGKTYLVYSFANHEASHVTFCSRTKPFDKAKKDIEKLNISV